MAVYLRGRCKKKHRHSDQCMTWYYDFMIRRRRYKEAIPEARTKADAEEVEVKEKKEVYEARYGRPSGDNDFCKFVDDIYLPYSHENKSSWYHDEFRCAVLKEFFKGKRFSEITQLLIINVRGLEKRFEIKPNHLLVLKNKGGRPYAVPLNRVARDVLEKLCAGRDAGTWLFLNKSTGQAIKGIKRSFTSACRKAGITDLRFHDLRHTFATRLKESHVDPITRRDLMGHATTEMTDDYTHSFTETKQDAVERLAVRQKNCPKIVPSQIQQHVLRAVSA